MAYIMRAMAKGLTPVQEKVLQVWTNPDYQRPPTFETVAQKTGLAGRGSVGQILGALQKKGYLDEQFRLK